MKFPWNCNPLISLFLYTPGSCSLQIQYFICDKVIWDSGVGQIQARHSKNFSLYMKVFNKKLLITSRWVLLCDWWLQRRFPYLPAECAVQGFSEASLHLNCGISWFFLSPSSSLASQRRKSVALTSCFCDNLELPMVFPLGACKQGVIHVIFLDFWGSVQPSLSSAPFSATFKMCSIFGLFRSF